MELVKWKEEYRGFINQKSYNIETGRYWCIGPLNNRTQL